MNALVPVRPSCPACAEGLVDDGEGQASCPTCGRIYDAAVVRMGVGAAIYRDAPVIELVPAHDRPPRSASLRVLRDGGVVEIQLGTRGLLGDGLVTAAASAILSSVFLLMIFHAIERTYAVGGVLVALALILSSHISFCCIEELVLERGVLSWRRHDQGGGESAVPLAEVAAAHDVRRSVKLTLTDGRSVEIGRGMGLPRPVRRWLVQRIGERAGIR